MTILKLSMIVFVLAVLVFHIIPQLPDGVERIERQAVEQKFLKHNQR